MTDAGDVEVEQRLRGLPGVVAATVEGDRVHLLTEAGTDGRAVRAAASTVLGPGARLVVLVPPNHSPGPVRAVVSDLAPTFAAVVAAVAVAGAGSVALSRALGPGGPRTGPAVTATRNSLDDQAVRTVVPAPELPAAVLGVELEREPVGRLIEPIPDTPRSGGPTIPLTE